MNIAALEAAGAKHWTKYGKDRYYLNMEDVVAALGGEWISSHRATITTAHGVALISDKTPMKFFYDVQAGRFIVTGDSDAAIIAAALEDLFADTDATEEALAVETVEDVKIEAAAAAPVRETRTFGLATPKQVSLIMSLIHEGAHEEGGYFYGPTTREDVQQMDRRSASMYIESLTGAY